MLARAQHTCVHVGACQHAQERVSRLRRLIVSVLSVFARLFVADRSYSARVRSLWLLGEDNTHRGARPHDHKVKSLALCRLS